MQLLLDKGKQRVMEKNKGMMFKNFNLVSAAKKKKCLHLSQPEPKKPHVRFI